MGLVIPEQCITLFDDVERRFRLLLAKGVVTGITEMQFNKWLMNLNTDEDRYLGARLLENLTFRSEQMVGSAIAHILESILPGELRRLNVAVNSVDDFRESVSKGDSSHPVRFVEVNDARGQQPGKSGGVIMRELHRLGGISNSLMIFAKDIAQLPDTVKCLVFVDDMLGTGKQFEGFSDANSLRKQTEKRGLIYCPLAAYAKGLSHLEEKCPWLVVRPVEEFDEQHRFFRAKSEGSEIWAIDEVNKVQDVRSHMQELCDRGGFRSSAKFSLELLIGFHHATPNNTLPIMYASTATWHNLLIR